MLETKSFTVHPDDEQSTIDLWASFGWNLKSSQEVKTKDSHLEQRGGQLVSVTESEHYVKLVFERDNQRANYQRLVELENTYYDIMARKPVPPKGIKIIIALLLLCLYVVPGVIYIVFKIMTRKKYEAALATWREEEKKAIDALQEARSIA